MNKITVIGFSASGKTSYLAGMYDAFNKPDVPFALLEKEKHFYLQKLWMQVNNNKWPGFTAKELIYNFSVFTNLKEVLNFEWLDYSGRALSNANFDIQDGKLKQLAESACLLILVNGESFAFQGNPANQERIQASSIEEYKRIVSQNLKKNQELQSIELLIKLSAQGVVLPPIAIVLTKSDLIEDQWAPYAKDILYDSFNIIFGTPGSPDKSIVMLTNTSLGSSGTRNGFSIKPLNVELPIAFGILSIIRQQKKFSNAQSISNKQAEDNLINTALSFFDDNKSIFINGEEKNFKNFFRVELCYID